MNSFFSKKVLRRKGCWSAEAKLFWAAESVGIFLLQHDKTNKSLDNLLSVSLSSVNSWKVFSENCRQTDVRGKSFFVFSEREFFL